MRLTLDLTPTLLRSAGVKNHLYYWARALAESRGHNEIEYFPFLNRMDPLHHDQGRESGIPDWRLVLIAALNHPATNPIARRMLPRFSLFHGSPQSHIPPRTHRLTSHIHDLTCWRMPEFHSRANNAAAYRMAESVWKRADGLIAVSESALRDAVELLGLDEKRIKVIPHGVPEEYFTALPDQRKRPYVLTVGTIEPRKNIDRLLDAWAALPKDARAAFDLVIAGPTGWMSTATMTRLKSGIPGVEFRGYVAESDLPALTAGATALAYPSLYEGFGFPLAQAMACGVPSLTSDISSMPEVAAGSALLVEPRSVSSITQALFRLLTEPSLRADLGARGKAYATVHYRWPQVARQSWDFFERVAS